MTTQNLDFKQIYYGKCPLCTNTMKHVENLVRCPCGFKIGADKFFGRCKRGSAGYWAVKHNSRTEEDNLSDICQIL